MFRENGILSWHAYTHDKEIWSMLAENVLENSQEIMQNAIRWLKVHVRKCLIYSLCASLGCMYMEMHITFIAAIGKVYIAGVWYCMLRFRVKITAMVLEYKCAEFMF